MPRVVLALASLGAVVGVACSDTQTPLQPASVSPQASGATSYEAIDLGTLGGGSSRANAINDSGQIVGWSITTSGVTHAFLWENRVMRDLGSIDPSDPTDFSEAQAIDNAGLVAGVGYQNGDRLIIWENGVLRDLGIEGGLTAQVEAMNARADLVVTPGRWDDYSPRAIVWHDGVLQDLGWLIPYGGTYALAMNNRGQIVGASIGYNSEAQGFYHPFLWQDGVLRDLGVFGRVECEDPTDPSPCAAQGQATGINERGQVVGWSQDSSGVHRPFLYQDGQMRDLGIFPGESVEPVAINQRGQIAGTHWRYGPAGLESGAFLWDGGTVQDLGSLGPAIAVTAMNERGDVVGWSGANWFTAHAVVWRDGVMYDLGLGPAGGDYSQAVAINAAGEIIGVSREPGCCGAYHALLWRPAAAAPLAAATR